MTRAPWRWPSAISGARDSTVGFVLSTTTLRPPASASSICPNCRVSRFRAFGIRSLLTCTCVAAKCSWYHVVLPEPCSPTKMINSSSMGRYIRKLSRIGQSLGPSEERGFAMWVGYDIAGASGDLSRYGLENVDGWSDARLAEYGVAAFKAATLEEIERWKR